MKSKEDLSLHYYYRVVGDVVVAGDLVWMTVANHSKEGQEVGIRVALAAAAANKQIVAYYYSLGH